MTTEDSTLFQPPVPGFKSGYVVLVGRPNVGKSTLMNAFLGEKLAIVSNKPQTTRHRLLGIYNDEGSQIVFLDTPGIHKPKEALNQFMVDQALSSIGDGDLIVVLLPADEMFGQGDRFIMERVRQSGVPFLALLNKIDLVKPDRLQIAWNHFEELTEGAIAQVAISALKEAGLEEVLQVIKDQLPEGPRFYPEDVLTDRSENFLLAELIREKVIRFTREEIPYATAVRIVSVEEKGPENPIVVHGAIAVERESQKGMLIGKGGEMLKRIGTNAREEMERIHDRKFFLDLKVEVRKNWRKDPKQLRRLGYTEDLA
ncbi:MAG: GTPase Era [Candidatus Omnitrophica bacterium]|nr:GTPase Era [Candidatus Omnitrophota bacterium]